jgi:hypothetical protein
MPSVGTEVDGEKCRVRLAAAGQNGSGGVREGDGKTSR